MKNVLIAGAGKSSTFLIDYMLENAKRNWKVVLMDSNAEAAMEKLAGNPHGEAAIIDIEDTSARQKLVQQADIVISIMPPHLHILLAQDCLKFKKNLITSSYVAPEIQAMDAEVKEAGLLFMCEMGLDPGIDHMSASSIIHSIHKVGGQITSFKSYCGGLVAPESNDNPWQYKITWNPKNVVNAGKGGANYLLDGKEVEIDYKHLFDHCKKIKVDNNDLGSFAFYPNRDSLSYLELYDLPDIKNFLRATLRSPQFTKGWNILVAAGLTDDTDSFTADQSTLKEWLSWKTGIANDANLTENFAKKYNVDDKCLRQLDWLGIFQDKRIYENRVSTSAEVLQQVLEEKWKMRSTDKDMVVLVHEVEYSRKAQSISVQCSMVVKGKNREHSAMAKSVGLPMAILAKRMLMLNDLKELTGVHIPVMQEVYVPLLKELTKHGIYFEETIN